MDTIVDKFKHYINVVDLSGAKTYFEELVETYEHDSIAWDYVFNKIYIHACLKKQLAFVNWLMELFECLKPVEQIAIRQVFSYGKYLLARPTAR